MILENRVAIVTGGARGFGKAICLQFAEEGCSMAVADILEDRAKQTVAEIATKGREAIAVKCDVTDSKQVNDMVARTLAKFGKVDILVNNAGALPRHLLAEEISEQEWDDIININLKSQFLCCKAIIPHMKAKKYGKIVCISSFGARHASGADVHYAAAKAGVLGLVLDLSLELAPFNITVNAVLPAPIPTEFGGREPPTPERIAAWGKNVPLGRAGTPEDIAKAALFFASEQSSWVTSQEMLVGGGMPMRAAGFSRSTPTPSPNR